MSKYTDWINVDIPNDYVEMCKNKVIDYKQNLHGDIKTRWVGDCGEEAIRIVCNNWKIPYKDMTPYKSWVDFIIGKHLIDFKTVATSYYPRENYLCAVTLDQLNKSEGVSTYVFGRFILNKNKIVILGWLPKEIFRKDAIYYMAGTKMSDKFTVNTDMYAIEVEYLNSPSTLFTEII